MKEKNKIKEELKNELEELSHSYKKEDIIKRIIYVNTGDVKIGGVDAILKSNAIGSCVVIAAYDSKKKVGALAHVMIPGVSSDRKIFKKTIYAADAIEEMINKMIHQGSNKNDIKACLVGGGNVLNRKDDTICDENIKSITEILNRNHIKIKAKAVGGTVRRSISFDVETGSIYYTEGDSKEKLLWEQIKI